MKAKSAAIFLTACAVTAIGWTALWPGRPAEPAHAIVPEPAAPSWQRDELDGLITALENGKSGEEQLQAALRLEKMPPEEVPSILETIEITRNHSLTLPAKALLIRWASRDPEAAMAWAWGKLRLRSEWRFAFREIGAAWAWRNPKGLKAWTLARLEAQPTPEGRSFGDLSAEEAEATDAPALRFDDLSRISGWLLREDPKLGMEIFLKRGGFSSDDSLLTDSFTDPRKIERALLAFPPEMIEPLKTRDRTRSYTVGPEIHAESLFRRWRELDPEGFGKSAYAGYLPLYSFEVAKAAAPEWKNVEPEQREKAARESLATLPEQHRPATAGGIAKEWVAMDSEACREWIETLPENEALAASVEYVHARAGASLDATLDWIERFAPERRGAWFVHAFDAWLKANPDDQPDFSGWSESRKRAWLDLAACKGIGGP